MNNLEQLLRETIGPALNDFTSIGARLYERIGNSRSVCIRFETAGTWEQYEAISLSVVDKHDGVIDRQTIPFAEIFKEMRDLTHKNKIDKHIWRSNGEYKWFGKPTAEDINALRDVVRNYIGVWTRKEKHMTIYTRDEAAKIVEMFDDILCENGIRVPSPDDDQRDPNNDVALYGETYDQLLDMVEYSLIRMLNRHTMNAEVKRFTFSGKA